MRLHMLRAAFMLRCQIMPQLVQRVSFHTQRHRMPQLGPWYTSFASCQHHSRDDHEPISEQARIALPVCVAH
jgi:hypothetical protein